MIGCGDISGIYLKNLTHTFKEVSLIGVCDLIPERAENFVKEAGSGKAYTNYIEMYDEALSKGVAYVAGSFFFLDGSHRNTMRLNFSFVAEEKMEPGMKLLGEIVKNRILSLSKDR